MDKNYLLIVMGFAIIIFASFTTGQGLPQATQSSSNTLGLEIEYPQYEYAKLDSIFKLHLHVFNKTSGFPMTNTSTSCYLHLYNIDGSHTTKSNMVWDGTEWEININAANFTTRGTHAYIIWCNTSNVGGFVSGKFDVNPAGYEYTEAMSITYVLLFGLAVLFFLLSAYTALTISIDNNRNEDGEIISINWKKYLKVFSMAMGWTSFVLITWMAWNISYAFTTFSTMADFFKVLYTLAVAAYVPLLILIVIFSFIRFVYDWKVWKELERGLTVT